MNGTKSILDRISNLISDDSKVLKDFYNRIDKENLNKSKAEEEKNTFEKEITNVQSDIDDITKASEISDRFSNLDEYMPGLKKLGKMVSLLDNLKDELSKIPEQIEKLENKIKELSDKSDDRSKTISKSEDELSKLEVELSDAKRYQSNLIELIDLAKSGDINKTREEVVETLVHVGFSDKDAVSAAKVILFPEDDLIPYFNDSIEENNIVETPTEVKEENDTAVEVNEESDSVEEEAPIEESEEVVKTPEEETNEEVIEDNSSTEDEQEISLDETQSEISLDEMDDEVKLNPVDVASNKDYDSIRKLINDYGFDASRFMDEDLDADESIIRNNVNFILEKDLRKEFVYEYPNVLSDSNLVDKYNYIIQTLNKSEEDIKMTPEILASYSKEDLEKLVSIAESTGINPKLVPLSMYLKGLQSFFRNYMALKDNNIVIDENELSKFSAVLSINPVDFKKSLQVLLDYKVDLKKIDGKIAIMDLAVKDIELANKMDMIINAGEEDLIKYYPEVLTGDVKELVNRLLFLQKSQIPYKTESHNKVVYQSFVLRQEVLDKVLEKKIELNEVLDKTQTNNNITNLIDDNDLLEELNKIEDNFEMVSNMYVEDYKEVLKLIKGKYNETNNSYVIGNISFSKNKVNRDINYLLSTFVDKPKEKILVASLLHDSRLSLENMQKVIDTLNIKVK